MFNESFATAFAQKSVQLWLREKGEEQRLENYRQKLKRRDEFRSLLQETKNELNLIYKNTNNDTSTITHNIRPITTHAANKLHIPADNTLRPPHTQHISINTTQQYKPPTLKTHTHTSHNTRARTFLPRPPSQNSNNSHRRKRHGKNKFRVPLELLHFLAACHVPQAHGLVVTARHDLAAVLSPHNRTTHSQRRP